MFGCSIESSVPNKEKAFPVPTIRDVVAKYRLVRTVRRYRVSAQTIRKHMRCNNQPIRARRPLSGQIMTRRPRGPRLLGSRRHMNWRRTEWNRVLLTDKQTVGYSYSDVNTRDAPIVVLLRGTCSEEGV